MKINVLFTSVGRRVELINKWREAYQKLSLNGNIIGTDIDPLAPAMHVLDKHFIVPPTNSHEFVNSVVEICNREHVHFIFPLIDPDISKLNKYREKIEAIGSIVMVIKSEHVKCTQDKWSTYKFFKSLGLHTPNSILPKKITNVNNLSFPLFAKPRRGSASIGAIKINNSDELNFYLNKIDRPIIQEFISGKEITCDIVSSLNKEVLAVVPRERIEVRNGEVSKGKTIKNNKIIKACVTIAHALEAIGPITVQCINNNNKPYFIEINARYGGGAPLGIAAGANSPEWFLKEASGIHFKRPLIGDFIENLYMTRSDHSTYITETILAKM